MSKNKTQCSKKVLEELGILGAKLNLLEKELKGCRLSGELYGLFGDMECDRKFYNVLQSLCEGDAHYGLVMDQKLNGDWSQVELKLPDVEVDYVLMRNAGMMIGTADDISKGRARNFTVPQLQYNVIAFRLSHLCEANPNHPKSMIFDAKLASILKSEIGMLQALRTIYLKYPQKEDVTKPPSFKLAS